MSTAQNQGPDPTTVRALYGDSPSPQGWVDNGDGTYTLCVVPTILVRRPWHARLRRWVAGRIYPEGCHA